MLTLKVLRLCWLCDLSNAVEPSDASDTAEAMDTQNEAGKGVAELLEVCLNAEQVPPTLTEVKQTLKKFFRENLYFNSLYSSIGRSCVGWSDSSTIHRKLTLYLPTPKRSLYSVCVCCKNNTIFFLVSHRFL